MTIEFDMRHGTTSVYPRQVSCTPEILAALLASWRHSSCSVAYHSNARLESLQGGLMSLELVPVTRRAFDKS